ncbi:MFS transporter [Tistrella sp. BH-R2-4]|jgi:predicted MFS family arabinose efflux permease|uniref:MFS transporter n=1 Tax=Tistrella arctica TaxID=3133430 RepID=A0ABU9YLF9_9PROT
MKRGLPEGALPAGRASAFSPLRHRLFRTIWLALLASNLGIWIQTVAAGWLMTTLVSAADMVALVQSATALPGLLFSLPGGLMADWWDRRKALLVSQALLFAGAALLALLDGTGGMTPWLLLSLIFVTGAGAALRLPAYQAVLGDMVPPRDVPQAVALGAVAYNLARAAGPALGGVIVASCGVFTAFVVGAVLNVVLCVVLLAWRPERPVSDLPREPFGRALAGGFHYLRQTRPVLATMAHCAAFTTFASALWALLPLVARDDAPDAPSRYGVLLACMGAGATLGAIGFPRLRDRLSGPPLIAVGLVAFAAGTVLPAVSPSLWLQVPGLVLAGAAWMTTLTSFNVMVQFSSASWVRARMLALYYISMHAGIAFGSWVSGVVADRAGLETALLAAALALLASLGLFPLFRLPRHSADDLAPIDDLPPADLAPGVEPGRDPIVVQVTYRVVAEDGAGFRRAMDGIRRIRARDGARRWTLAQNAGRPECWVESFEVGTWVEDQRRRRRMTMSDRETFLAARRFHRGADKPRVSRWIIRGPR